jgi:hypothetical protein
MWIWDSGLKIYGLSLKNQAQGPGSKETLRRNQKEELVQSLSYILAWLGQNGFVTLVA